MGPRSENRGYDLFRCTGASSVTVLQWVHGPRTVVIWDAGRDSSGCRLCFNGSTVREPWLSIKRLLVIEQRLASMGPRSENRGYQMDVAGA